MSTTTSTNPTPAPNDNRLITVFESTEQYNIKHPLNYPWSLWLKAGDKEPAGRHGAPPAAKSQEQEPAEVPDKPKTSMELWAEKVQHIGTVGTVEDFWCVVNNIPGALSLQNMSDYFFFREGIVPAWEDPAHVGGGQFVVSLGDRGAPSGGQRRPPLDWEGFWLNALLAVIGCTVRHHDRITGVNFGRRYRGDRIQIWMGPTTEEQRGEIEKDLAGLLAAGLNPGQPHWNLKYSAFEQHGHGHGGAGRREHQGGGAGRRDQPPRAQHQ